MTSSSACSASATRRTRTSTMPAACGRSSRPRGSAALIKAVEKVDRGDGQDNADRRPTPACSRDLAMDFASILSKEYADALLKAKTRGAAQRRAGRHRPLPVHQLQRRRTVHGRQPRLLARAFRLVSNLNFAFVPDPAERFAKLKAGCVSGDGRCRRRCSLKAAKADPKLAVARGRTRRRCLPRLQHELSRRSAMPRVRKALGMAIDRQAIVDAVYGGGAAPRTRSCRAPCGATTASIIGDIYNVDEAKRGLAEARRQRPQGQAARHADAAPYSPDLAKTARDDRGRSRQSRRRGDGGGAARCSAITSASRPTRDATARWSSGGRSDNGDAGQFPVASSFLRGGQACRTGRSGATRRSLR